MIARRNIYLGSYNSKKKKNGNDKDNDSDNNINPGINGISPHYAKHLREELYRKTHFKAMENLTMFKTSTMNHNIFKTWSKEDKKHQKNLEMIKNYFIKVYRKNLVIY
jgi:hypothetical protein